MARVLQMRVCASRVKAKGGACGCGRVVDDKKGCRVSRAASYLLVRLSGGQRKKMRVCLAFSKKFN